MAATDILIRAQEPEDMPAVAEMFGQRSIVRDTLQMPYQSVGELRERFGTLREGDRSLVAVVEGRVVGMLGLTVYQRPRRAHVGTLGMNVHEAFQGRGIGTALMASAIDLADNWYNLRRLELEVYTDNAAAIRLYEKFGFVVEGTLRAFAYRDGVFVDAFVMARLRPSQPLSSS